MLGDKNLDSEEYAMLSTGVYPPIFHSFRKKGIFCFRFFKNFRWRYVLVDNRLPCNKIYNDNDNYNNNDYKGYNYSINKMKIISKEKMN